MMAEVINGGAYGEATEKQKPVMSTAAYKKFLDRMRRRRRMNKKADDGAAGAKEKAGNLKKSQSAVTVDTMEEVIDDGAYGEPIMSTAAYKKLLDRLRLGREEIHRINKKPPHSDDAAAVPKEKAGNRKTEKLYESEMLVSSLCFHPAPFAFASTFELLNMPQPEKLYTKTVPSIALRAYEQAAVPPIPCPYFFPRAFCDRDMPEVDMGSDVGSLRRVAEKLELNG